MASLTPTHDQIYAAIHTTHSFSLIKRRVYVIVLPPTLLTFALNQHSLCQDNFDIWWYSLMHFIIELRIINATNFSWTSRRKSNWVEVLMFSFAIEFYNWRRKKRELWESNNNLFSWLLSSWGPQYTSFFAKKKCWEETFVSETEKINSLKMMMLKMMNPMGNMPVGQI